MPLRHHTAATGVIATALLTVVLRLVYGAGALGYDASFALEWGRELAGGRLPELESQLAPTPHPLATLAGVPLSLLGDDAFVAVVLLTLLAFAALGVLAYVLGARLFTPAVGVLFAAIVLTRPALVNEALQALVDIPFLALVAAAACAAAARRPPPVVLVLLALAGLLRPEAWPLAALYAVVVWRGLASRERVVAGALVLSAPLLWIAFDAIVTGDALYSLHGTRELAADLGRPRDVRSALIATPQFLRVLLQPPVAWLGLAGCLAALWFLYERSLAPAAVAGLGIAGFAVLGAAGLPVLIRYVLIPALVLALFAAVAALGWTALHAESPVRRPWSLAAVLAGAVLAASIPSTVDDTRLYVNFIDGRHDVQRALHSLVRSPAARATLERCAVLAAPDQRPVPLLAYWLRRKPGSIAQRQPSARGDTAFISYGSEAAARQLSLLNQAVPLPEHIPPGIRLKAGNPDWRLYAAC